MNPVLARRDTPVTPLGRIGFMSNCFEPAESLVLLCPKANSFERRGLGGYGARRPEDVAIALAGLSERVFLFGLLTVVQDRSVQSQVVYYAHLEVVDLAIARGWKAPKGSMIWRKMAILALVEVIGVNCTTCETRRRKVPDDNAMVPAECPECGRWRTPKATEEWRKLDCATCQTQRKVQDGKVRDDKGKIAAECLECDDTGLRRFTEAQREEALEIGGRRWLFRYEEAWRRINGWKATLEDHLRTRLARAVGGLRC
jgi:ssDNA-binding Zn-finger/Zn-ribbon topoisomerase 1